MLTIAGGIVIGFLVLGLLASMFGKPSRRELNVARARAVLGKHTDGEK